MVGGKMHKRSKEMIELGRVATDKITGFSGVVTGHAIYITGCNQCLVTPRKDGDKDATDGRWIDEGRLEPGEMVFDPASMRASNPGGPRHCDSPGVR